jgi:protoheme IX farnesyltransferase
MSAPSHQISSPIPKLQAASRSWARIQDFVALTRPRVLALVLFTAPPAMALGAPGWPEASVMLGVLVGAALIGGGCGAINAWYERDADARMARTCDRPLPAGRLTPRQALVFGSLVSAAGVLVLLELGGPLAAIVGVLTLAHYVGIYTVWLKPRSPASIVIGGAAGAAAPLIADAAVDGSIGIWGVVLFTIVFLWTPPHFWAIALYRKHEYEAGGFPMLPSVVGNSATRRRMLAYTLVLVPVTLLPWVGGVLGPGYAAVAIASGVWFAASIVRAMRVRERSEDRRVFFVSIAYLAAIFSAMFVDLFLR